MTHAFIILFYGLILIAELRLKNNL